MHTEAERLQRERDITVRSLRAERVVVEEVLRDPTRDPGHKDDALFEAELIDGMLTRMGECPAVITTNPDSDDPTEATVNTPIRYCVKSYHEGGDHEWL